MSVQFCNVGLGKIGVARKMENPGMPSHEDADPAPLVRLPAVSSPSSFHQRQHHFEHCILRHARLAIKVRGETSPSSRIEIQCCSLPSIQ